MREGADPFSGPGPIQQNDNQDIKIDETKLIKTIGAIDDLPLVFAKCSTAELNDLRRTDRPTQAVGWLHAPLCEVDQ
eukprot:4289886-Pyramimonas_sp.AAC.1